MRGRTVGVLMSGGIDSAVLLRQLLRSGWRAQPLYVRCGLRWEAAEMRWLRRYLRAVRSSRLLPLRVLEVPVRVLYEPHWSLTGRRVPSARSADAAVYLPGRNALLLSAAAIACARQGISTLALGTLGGNPFGDATPRFFARMAQALSLALNHPVRILAPLRRKPKAAWVRAARRLPLQLTFSCLNPRGHRPCGRCNKCAERSRALRQAGAR